MQPYFCQIFTPDCSCPLKTRVYNDLQKHLVFFQSPSSSAEKLWNMKAYILISLFHNDRNQTVHRGEVLQLLCMCLITLLEYGTACILNECLTKNLSHKNTWEKKWPLVQPNLLSFNKVLLVVSPYLLYVYFFPPPGILGYFLFIDALKNIYWAPSMYQVLCQVLET